MSRYIEVSKAMELCNEFYFSEETCSVKGLFDSAPSIDIVRCGECKYKHLYDDGETKYYYCALEDRPNRQWSVDDTDFCSWGERKTDEPL